MKRAWVVVLLALAMSLTITGCTRDETPTATLSPQLTPTSDAGSMTATPDASPAPPTTGMPQATPMVSTSILDARLVYSSNGSLVLGGSFGEDGAEIAGISGFDDADIRQSRIAIIQNKTIQLYDLASGSVTIIPLSVEGEILASDIAWSRDASSAVCAVTSLSGQSESGEQLATLYILEPGRNTPAAVFPTNENLIEIVGYEGSVLSCLASGRGLLPRVISIDLAAGMYLKDPVVETEGTWAASEDLAHLLTSELTADANIVTVYDLFDGTRLDLVDLQLAPNLEIASISWAPDASRFAYILRERRQNANQDAVGLGLWIYDLATGSELKILDEDGADSSIITWSPKGEYLLVKHVGLDQTSYHYAIRPDGADRRFIVAPDDTTVLGWATGVSDIAIQLQTDDWQAEFLRAADDIEATARVAARFINRSDDLEAQATSNQLATYLIEAGWQQGLAPVSVLHLNQGIAVVSLPDGWIGVLAGDTATRAASGDLIVDARVQGDRLGLIYATIGASAMQPSYVLLQEESEEWLRAWTPQGQRDWITTDGDIAFVGEGLDTLRVTGTSFGIVLEPDIFDECHVCAHRELEGLWQRTANGYQRKTALPTDASLAEIISEMTLPSPYAAVYKAFTRIALGQSVEGLVANAEITTRIRTLELAAEGKRLIPEIAADGTVRINDMSTNSTYVVDVDKGVITGLERQ